MVLLTILNPFLTREPRSKGFEGIATEIFLIQHVQTKTNSMHARQDRVLGEVSWTKGQCQKARMSLATGGCPRIRTPSSNAPRGKMAAPYSSCSSHRVRTLSSARSGPTQCRRHKSARSTMGLSRSLSRVQHTNPGLARSQDKAQIEVRAPQAHRQRVEP